MAKRKKSKATASKKPQPKPVEPQSPAQPTTTEVGRITGQIQAYIKNAQINFLHIGESLVDVRNRKLYEVLKDETLLIYADKRLHLGPASVYRYMRIYEWVKQYHPGWLASPVVGRIPDLSDIADLMWLDEELAKKELEPKKKAALEELRTKALAGDLPRSEVRAFRRGGRNVKGMYEKAISGLLSVRRQLSKSTNPPTDSIAHITAAIESLQNHLTLVVAGFDWDRHSPPAVDTLFFA
jgi:hypothetical protein